MEDSWKFFIPVQVRYAETDMQGHVFPGNYAIYFDMALTEYIKAIGFGMEEFYKEGVDFYYVESLCQYEGQAFFDEILCVNSRVCHIGNTSFKLEFEIHEHETGRRVCKGHIVAATVERQTSRTIRVPKGFRKAVEEFEGREFHPCEVDVMNLL